MATITAAAGGGLWTAAATWTGGIVPTAADDVKLASTSGAVTINAAAACRSLDCTGYTGTLTHNTGVALSIGDATAGSGSIALKFVTGMGWSAVSATCLINFISTSATVQTVDFGGKQTGSVTFSGVGGSWQLSSGMSVISSGTVTLTAGTFNTNGQACSWGFFSSSNSNIRTLTLGSSAITTVGGAGNHWDFGTSTNLTFNAGTSTITLSFTNTWGFSGGGKAFNNLVINSPGGVGTSGFHQSNTFNNVTYNANGRYNWLTLDGSTTQTITGTLTVNSASPQNRVWITSSATGVTSTINAGAVSLTNADFIDIIATGAATWTGTGIGDGQGNTGITFPASRTLYRVGVGGNWTDTNWSLTSGGAVGNNPPLAHDNVLIDSNASGTIGTSLLTTNSPLGKNIDCTGFTGTLSIGGVGSLRIFGSLTLSTGMTMGGGESFQFMGRGTHTITSNGKQFGSNMTFSGINGSYTLTDAFRVNNNVTLNYGALIATNTVTISTFTTSSTGLRSLSMGNSTWFVNGTSGTIWNCTNITNMTADPGTSTVNFNSFVAAGTRIYAPGFPLYDVKVSAGNDNFNNSGIGMTCHTLDFTGFSGSWDGNGIYTGGLTLGAGMTVVPSTNTNSFTGTGTITSNGVQLNRPLTITTSGTMTLGDDLNLSGTGQRALTINQGTFDANNKNVTAGSFASNTSSTRTIYMGSGTWTITGTTSTIWTTNTITGLTLDYGTSTLVLADTSATTKSFVSGGKPINNLVITGGSLGSIVSISSSSSFNDVTVQTGPSSMVFGGGVTIRGNLTAKGAPGALITIGSNISGTARTLTRTGTGYFIGDYLSIQDSTVTGGAGWFAGANSVNVSNNTGWVFTQAVMGIAKAMQYAVKNIPQQVMFNTNQGRTSTIPRDFTTNQTGAYSLDFMLRQHFTGNIGFFNPGTSRLDVNVEGNTDKVFVWFTDSANIGHLLYKSANSMFDGIKHNLIVDKSSTAITVYLDGLNVGSFATTLNTFTTSSTLNVGNGFVAVDNVRVWNRNLTSPEVAAIAAHSGEPRTGLQLEWLFNNANTTTIVDTSGNGNNGTYSSAAIIGAEQAKVLQYDVKKVLAPTKSLIYMLKSSTRAGQQPLNSNWDFSSQPTFVAPQTQGNWIDGTATGGIANAYGWHYSPVGAGTTIQFDSPHPFSGKTGSLKLHAVPGTYIEAQNNATGYWGTNQTAIKPNTTYRLSGWIMSQNVSGSASGGSIQFITADSTGTGSTEVTVTSGGVTTNQTWKYYETYFTTSPTAAYAHLEARVYAHNGAATLQGDWWFANLAVQEVSGMRQLRYGINIPATLAKTLKYDIKKPIQLAKTLRYLLTSTPIKLTKGMTYDIRRTLTAITKTLRYGLRRPTILSKTLGYNIHSATTFTKSLRYVMKPSTALFKALKYTLKTSPALTKPLRYGVVKRPFLTKTLRYVMKPSTVVALYMVYRLKGKTLKQLNMTYETGRSFNYEASVPHQQAFTPGTIDNSGSWTKV